jgi:hypothetical protein
MRLFRSPWTYLAWLALILFQIWHELYPHPRSIADPWPTFSAVTYIIGSIFCIFLMFSIGRLISNALERAILTLFTVTFALSLIADLHALGHFHTALPSFRLVFLTINVIVVLLTGIRFVQALREPSTPGILSRTPASTE